MKRVTQVWSLSACCIGLCTAVAMAMVDPPASSPVTEAGSQPAAPIANGDVEAPASVALGIRFESQSAGISFQPPASMLLLPASGEADVAYVGTWGDIKLNWNLTLGQALQAGPTPLTSRKDNYGKSVPGLLETTVDRLKMKVPGGKVLRQDVTNTAQGGIADPHHPEVRQPNVGLIAIRYTNGAQRFLSQQALIQASERLYYLLTFTTPGAKRDDGPEDTGERVAVETFNAMIDSIKLLDRGAIKADQDLRLERTRSRLLNFSAYNGKPLKDVLVSEQWLRVMRDGKDVGYTYITEEAAAGIPRPLTGAEIKAGRSTRDFIRPGDGILIGIRARMISQEMRSNKTRGDVQTDNASWFYTSADLKHEDWSRVIVSDDFINPHKNEVKELGSSDRRKKPKLVMPKQAPGTLPGPNPPQPFMIDQEEFELNVTVRTDQDSPPTITRKLSPWYIPQAVDHLLPRLLLERLGGPKETKKYLFATYVSRVHEVMQRYVDVAPQAKISFNGQIVWAIAVRDRLGLDGSVTTHYISPEGAYLGSENLDEKILVIPSDADTLARVWKNANLSNPNGVEQAPRATTAPASPSVMPPVIGPTEPGR